VETIDATFGHQRCGRLQQLRPTLFGASPLSLGTGLRAQARCGLPGGIGHFGDHIEAHWHVTSIFEASEAQHGEQHPQD
jgi:hypothetical protein